MLARRADYGDRTSPLEQRTDHRAKPPACLARLVRAGLVSPAGARAAGRFSALYRAAAAGRDGASEQVHLALLALGGARSPAGSCVANVIGAGEGLTAWATSGWQRMPVHATYATGILIAGLGTLASHFERTAQRAA